MVGDTQEEGKETTNKKEEKLCRLKEEVFFGERLKEELLDTQRSGWHGSASGSYCNRLCTAILHDVSHRPRLNATRECGLLVDDEEKSD